MHSDASILHQPGPLSLTEVMHSSKSGEMLCLDEAMHCMPHQIPANPESQRAQSCCRKLSKIPGLCRPAGRTSQTVSISCSVHAS